MNSSTARVDSLLLLRSFALTCCALAALCSEARAQVRSAPPDILLTNVRVLGPQGERAAQLYFHAGSMSVLEAGAEPGGELPHTVRVIDGANALALPAFVDAYSHAGCEPPAPVAAQDMPPDERAEVLADMRLANRKGIRPAFEVARAFTLAEDKRAEWRKAGFGALVSAPRGALLGGTSALVALREAAPRDALVVPHVWSHASFDTSGPGYPSTLMGAFAQLRQFFYDAQWHAELRAWREAGGAGARPPFDPELEAGASLLAGKRLIMAAADEINDIERWLALAREFDVPLALSGARDAWQVATSLAQRDLLVVLTLDWDEEVPDPAKPKKKRGKSGRKGAEAAATQPAEGAPSSAPASQPQDEESQYEDYEEPLALRAERRRLWLEQRDCALRLHEAGVEFAFGTGAGEPAELIEKVRKLVEAGLPIEVARAALSERGARFAGAPRAYGTIADEADANVALWTADPLAKDGEKARLTWLFIDGYPHELPKKDDEQESDEQKDGEKGEAKDASKEDASADEPSSAPASSQPASSQPAGEPSAYEHELEFDLHRAPRTKTGGNALIRGARVHSAVGPAFDGDVLVQGGRIAAIGRGLALPEGVLELDARGKHLVPGAVDTHSHIACDGGLNEGTVSISAECDITDVIDARDPAIYRALAGGTTTIQVLHGSANAIGGRSEVLRLRFDRTADELRFEGAPQGIKFALGENPKRSNFGAPGQRFPNSRMGVEAVFERAFGRAREYQAESRLDNARSADDRAPLRRDLRLEVLSKVLDGSVGVHAHCYRADEILMLLGVAERFGFRVRTLQHVLEGFKVAREIAAHGAGPSTFSDWWAYKLEAYDAIPHNAALLDQAGAVSSINSDSPELIRHLYQEGAKSVRYAGLDPVRALALSTINSARQLELEERIGSIEVGKDADLALFDGDPLSFESKALWTMVLGEIEFERRDAFELEARPAPAQTWSEPDRSGALADESGEWLAIVNAQLHPITGPDVERGTLLVRGTRIHSLGAGLAIPVGARVLDAQGAHVWPGMIALHTALGLREIDSVRGADDQTELGGNQPDVRTAVAIHADSAHLAVTRHNGILRAEAAPQGGGPIRGQSCAIRLMGDTTEELVIEGTGLLHVRFPAPPRRGARAGRGARSDEPRVSPELEPLRQLFAAAREYGRVAEILGADGLHAFPPFEPRLQALAPYAMGKRRVALHADSPQAILGALEFAHEQKLDAVLYGATDAWKVAPAIARAGLPVAVGPVLGIPSTRFDPYDACYANAAVLRRAGVEVALFVNDPENPRHLPDHAAMARAFGLARSDALAAITYVPARILGLEAELGSLAPGKLADVIVTDGDLLDVRSRVLHAFCDGKPVDLSNRQTQLYERYRARLENRPAPR